MPGDPQLGRFPVRPPAGFVIHHYVSPESIRRQPDPFLYTAAQCAPGQLTAYPKGENVGGSGSLKLYIVKI